MSAQVRDMTKGSPAKLILLFAVPLMLGNIFQQLYTMVDTIVVGQVAGVQALAALGAVEWIMWMTLGVSTGVTQGFSILISQHYGAKKWNDLKKTVAHSYLLTAVTAILLLLISQLAARWLLVLLNTPDNIIGMSLIYLRIVFCGIPIVAAYNIFASVLRALGNSRTPLIAMIIAAFINVVLDLVFVAGFNWSVAGAALATVIAQAFSAFYCFLIVRKIEIVHTDRDDFAKVPGLNRKLFGLGAPILFQDVIISVGGLAVQFVINGYGFLFVAGFTATNKLYGVLEMAAISYGYAVVSYVGQNLGAGEITRIKKRSSCELVSCLSYICVYQYSDVSFWKDATFDVYFRRSRADKSGTGNRLALSFYYGILPVYPLFSVCIPFCITGARKYHDSDVERSGRIFCQSRCGTFTTETDWSEWDFLCRDCSVDRSCCFADDQLLYQHSQICLMHENLL